MRNLNGKRFLVFGVASNQSIAWAIARELGNRGASVTLGCEPSRLRYVTSMIKDQTAIEDCAACELTDEEAVRGFFTERSGPYDGLVHSVAYASTQALRRPIVDTTEEDFTQALLISSFSLLRLARNALSCLSKQASLLTITYIGGTRVVPMYRVMGTAKAALQSLVRELAASLGPLGLRVNAISAGPLRTRAASRVPDFEFGSSWVENNTPLRRNITLEEVAQAGCFLLSPESSGITGQILYVDAGFNIMAMPPDIGRILIEPATSPPEGPK